MAFKMKGFPMQKGISPIKQKNATNVPLSEEEKKKGVMVTGGSTVSYTHLTLPTKA